MKKFIGALVLILCLTVSGCGEPPSQTYELDGLPGLSDHCNADAIFKLRDNWYYSTISGKSDENIEGLFAAMYPQYADILGEDAMSYKPVIIYDALDDPDDEGLPYTSPHDRYTVMTLAVGDSLLWARAIYQLSHEMTHYAFQSVRTDLSIEKDNWSDRTSGWNEEIICEAMSLYMLNHMSENWDMCSLSEINSDYGSSINDYLQDEYSEGENLSLKHGTIEYTGEEFKELSDAAGDGKDREEHRAERNYCYDLFKEYGNNVIGEVLHMYDHYNSKYDYIDYAAWVDASQYPDFVKELSLIQPTILMDG